MFAAHFDYAAPVSTSPLQESYDRVAAEYARRIYDELDGKPFDRLVLDRLVAQIGAGRDVPVCDLGCGPGHIARYLHDRGVNVIGVDLSPEMVSVARKLNPEIAFRQGDMHCFDAADASFSAIVAFYSLIHVPLDDMRPVLVELRRVLQPGAPLIVAFHIGHQALRLDEWWGHKVAVDFYFFESESMITKLSEAGFVIESANEREPYPDVEHPSRRAYIVARREA